MSRWTPIELETPADIAADETFDLKGEVCPYTFVKSKLMLEMMNRGRFCRSLWITTNQPSTCQNL